MRRLVIAAGLAALVLPASAQAQREVYDPEPPRGSAYLRFVNGLGAEVEVRPDFLPAQRLGTTAAQRVGAYTVVENVATRRLTVELREGGRLGRATIAPQPDSFMTVLVQPGPDGSPQAIPLPEEMNFNRARARLAFYNLVTGCDAGFLRIHPEGPTIFEGVAPAAARNRSVNPVTAQVQAGCGGRQAAPFALQGLEPGQAYSVFLVGGTEPTAFLLRDVTTPWRR